MWKCRTTKVLSGINSNFVNATSMLFSFIEVSIFRISDLMCPCFSALKDCLKPLVSHSFHPHQQNSALNCCVNVFPLKLILIS